MQITAFIQKNLLWRTIWISLFFTINASAETLQNALVQTLRTNPNVLITEKERSAVTQALREAKAGYLPTLDATASYGVEHAENPSIPTLSGEQTLGRQEAGITANQMLFDGFSTSSEIKRNKARLTSAEYKILGAAQDTALSAVQAYLNVLQEQKLVSESKRNLNTHQQVYDLIKKRSESGIDQNADLTQAAGRLELAKANLAAEQSNLNDADSNYFQIVGENPDHLTLPASPAAPFMPYSEPQAVKLAIAHHPILASAKADMAAAYAQHESSKSKNYPRFDLQLSAARDDNLNGLRGKNNDEQAMIRMNYNLYHGGADKARQNETAYLYQQSAETMHKTYRQVINNIQLAWNSWKTAQQRLPLLMHHRDDAFEAFKAYKQQFQLEKRTLLDVLDSQNEYYQAEHAYTEGEFKEKLARYKILNGIGGLIQAEHLDFPVK